MGHLQQMQLLINKLDCLQVNVMEQGTDLEGALLLAGFICTDANLLLLCSMQL